MQNIIYSWFLKRDLRNAYLKYLLSTPSIKADDLPPF